MTILSIAAVRDANLDPALVTARIVGPSIERTVSLAGSHVRPQTKAAREMGRLAAELLRQQAGEGWWPAHPIQPALRD